MTKHYVLRVNPQAEYDWDRYVLLEPFSGVRPDLSALIANAIEDRPGAYLVAVNLEVRVLERSLDRAIGDSFASHCAKRLPGLSEERQSQAA
ncbi:hypothetical protein KR51_00004000 [Rubidibacter lacunae KORDI 51-2]|uniref:Uncharacterized protein n=2 Tax=Rubidibacter TaxID=582491 RepID=U5DPS6_9CHRO|nr:hypothetical protein KR51_00004000 [Rubidibacter lacunae KORDI 51-2]